MPRVQLRSRTAAVVVASAALAATGIVTTVWSMRRAPAEVRTLAAVLRRLSQGNDLGDQPLHFMVASGTYTAQYAAIEKQPPTAETNTRISFSYSRSDNLLTMTPQPR